MVNENTLRNITSAAPINEANISRTQHTDRPWPDCHTNVLQRVPALKTTEYPVEGKHDAKPRVQT